MTTNTPEIRVTPLTEIVPYDKNPRDNSIAIGAVAKSIKEFGFLVPIVVDKDAVIVAGHTRYEAAKQLNLTEAPVLHAVDLTDEQVQAFRLIDNKTAELATWDFDLLAEEITALSNSGIDLVPFGWSQSEIDCLSAMVDEDCIAESLPDEYADGIGRPETGDGVTGAKRRLGTGGVTRDPKSVRVAIGEIAFFVDIVVYREWAHEVRRRNSFDMARVIEDLSGKLEIEARPLARMKIQERRDEKAMEETKQDGEGTSDPVPEETTEELTRPARKRPAKKGVI